MCLCVFLFSCLPNTYNYFKWGRKKTFLMEIDLKLLKENRFKQKKRKLEFSLSNGWIIRGKYLSIIVCTKYKMT